MVLSSRQRSILTAVQEFLPRPNDDDAEVPLWPSGSERKEVCSWSPFWRYWCKKFPNIKMRKRGADTCTECLQATYALCNVAPPTITGDANADVLADGAAEGPKGEDDNNDDNVQLVSAIANVEEKLNAARLHVTMYQSQRTLVNNLISVAKSDVSNNLPFAFCRKVITIDMR